MKKSEEQKDAEAEVEDFRQELGPFVVAAETTRMPMMLTDATEPGNPIIFANDAFLSLTGYEREEVLAKCFNSLIAGCIDPETMALAEAAFAGSRLKLRWERVCRIIGSTTSRRITLRASMTSRRTMTCKPCAMRTPQRNRHGGALVREAENKDVRARLC